MLIGAMIAIVSGGLGMVVGFFLGAAGRQNIDLNEEVAQLRRAARVRTGARGPEVN